MNDDLALLHEYARRNSEEAFGTLVSRYVNLVYSVALRQVRDPQLAEEITQAVFIILARKTDSLGDNTILPGWLCRTARYTSANALTIQRRRQHREQEAHMQTILNQPANDETWMLIAPLLDAALEKLGRKDHDALVLRFFENKNFSAIGAALGASEDAAKMRVNRALEKLRKFFAKRGVSSTTAILAGTISVNSVQAAPIGLPKAITAVAITKGAAASTSTLTFVKGALKIMAWTKAKTAIVAGMGVLLVASVAPHIWYYHLSPDSWRHRFEAAYRLRHGQVLRYIPPPFIPERLIYYRTQDPAQARLIPSGPTCVVFKQDKQGHLISQGFGFGPKQFPLWLSLRVNLGLKPYEFEGPNHLLNLPINGDWTIKQGITQETLLKALEPILWKVTGHHIVFEKRTVERDVIVVTGNHFTAQPGTAIQIYAENLHDNSYDHYGNLKALFDDVETRLEIRFIDETTFSSHPFENETSNLIWTLHQDSDAIAMRSRRIEMTSEVLKHLADQTGLTFTREQRPVDVWFVTEKQ